MARTFRSQISNSRHYQTRIMRKLLLAAALCATLPAAAQAPRNAIKLNVISLSRKIVSTFYEHQLADNRSLNLGLLVVLNSQDSSPAGAPVQDKEEERGFALTGEYRFYPAGHAMRGWFLGPYLRFQHYSATDTYIYNSSSTSTTKVEHTRLTTYGGGGVFGWKGQFCRRFCLEPFLGIGYAAGEIEDLDPNNGLSHDELSYIRGLELRPGLTIGYIFGKAPK